MDKRRLARWQKLSRKAAGGFTLIEVALVLAVMSIVSLAVMLTLLPKLRHASLEEVVERISECDRIARTIARQGGKSVRLLIDPQEGTIAVEEAEKPARLILKLSGGLELAAVLTQDGPRSDRAEIEFKTEGRSESYAIGVYRGHEPPAWTLFAGLTGETERKLNDRQIQAIFDKLR